MDMIETVLDSSGDKDCEDDKVALSQRLAIVESDSSARDCHSPILTQSGFALKPEVEHTGALGYRVVEFGSDSSVDALPQEGVQGSVPGILTTSQMNGSGNNEARLALIASNDMPADGSSTVVVSGGHFYVIGDVLTNTSPRSVAPRTSETLTQRLPGSTREEKRRVTHNEVERRRRDKINTWICRLAKIMPDCAETHSKNSQQSKGGILAKACDYITELRQHNEELANKVKESQRKEMDLRLLKQEVEVLKSENAALKNENAVIRTQLQQQRLLSDLPP